MLREQEELSLDSHQVSEELVDPDLVVGSDRTQRHGNATCADLESVPGTTSVPSPLVLLAALVLCEEKEEASFRGERRPLPRRPPAPYFATATARVDSFFVSRDVILSNGEWRSVYESFQRSSD